jgi:hypothetical protein
MFFLIIFLFFIDATSKLSKKFNLILFHQNEELATTEPKKH